jgi:signal transduction histidine kinase
MRLSEFIRKNKEAIYKEWVAFARDHISCARNMDLAGLHDHIEGILQFIADDMDTAQSRREQGRKSKGLGVKAGGTGDSMAESHANLRGLAGFNSVEVLSEYRALRASIIRLWEGTRAGEETDYSDITRFNEAIDQALSESLARYERNLERARNLFLGTLIHDLGNPLRAISYAAKLIKEDWHLEEERLALINQISTSAARMSKLVAEIIDVVRVSFGQTMPVAPKPMDMRIAVEQVVKESEIAHPDRNVFIKAEGDLKGEWDNARIIQLLSNLVENAIQYSAKSSEIDVIARGEPKEVEVAVHNEGTPIPANVIPSLFNPMTRGKSGKQQDKPSSNLGLGLFIAKEIVEAHGGEIYVASNEAEGTTFVARIPRACRK